MIAMLLAATAVAGEFTESFDLRADELRVVNLIGEIRVEPAGGDEFEIMIEVRGDDASRELIEFDLNKGSEAVVSVIFPTDKERKYVYPQLGRGKTTIRFGDETDPKASWLGKVVRGIKGDKITVSGRGRRSRGSPRPASHCRRSIRRLCLVRSGPEEGEPGHLRPGGRGGLRKRPIRLGTEAGLA